MTTTSIKSETIIIKDPSEKLLSMIKRMKEHKQVRRQRMQSTQPLFTLEA